MPLAIPYFDRPHRFCLAACLTLGLALPGISAAEEVFAEVNGTQVTVDQSAQALRNVARQTFYHGSPPEKQLREFQREVADELIERLLLQQEGIRRGLCEPPDRAALNDLEAGEACREALRKAVDATVEAPSETELQAFYRANTEAFTEPARRKVSLILLGVDPAAGQPAWAAARDKAEDLRERIEDGADFAELARRHSTAPSAENGGEMGYLHRGMLGQPIDEALADMEPGELAGPVALLEGFAIVRLDALEPSRQRPLAEVRERAVALWQREERARRWAALVEQLRNDAQIEMDRGYLEPRGPDTLTADS